MHSQQPAVFPSSVLPTSLISLVVWKVTSKKATGTARLARSSSSPHLHTPFSRATRIRYHAIRLNRWLLRADVGDGPLALTFGLLVLSRENVRCSSNQRGCKQHER